MKNDDKRMIELYQGRLDGKVYQHNTWDKWEDRSSDSNDFQCNVEYREKPDAFEEHVVSKHSWINHLSILHPHHSTFSLTSMKACFEAGVKLGKEMTDE